MSKKVFKFTDRDSQILLTLYKHRFLSISQIQQVHFPSLQTAYRRMRILKEAGFVTSFTVPNIEESIFSVAKKGMNSVAESLGVGIKELKWTDTKTKPKDYYFMQHFLAINDFRIALKQICDTSSVTLLGFIPDYFGEKIQRGGIKKYIKDIICDIDFEREEISHTPDGVFALEKNSKFALFFLEIDRGTEVVSNVNKGVLKSLRFYISYLLNGKYQRYTKDFGVESFKGFRSLYVTTSDKRLQNIRQATDSLKIPQKVKRFHWITTFEKINEENIFNPIWVSIDPNDSNSYQIG
ncbi:MAG: replication-relaxation family protein [Methanosarcinaceae archaeon]